LIARKDLLRLRDSSKSLERERRAYFGRGQKASFATDSTTKPQ